MAARADRPVAAVSRLGPGDAHRAWRLLVLRPDACLRHLPRARHARRNGRREPARQHHQVARTGPLLPLVHLRLHPGPVRRARLRLLAVGRRRPLDARQHRPGADDGHGQRDRDQHRARARPQARQPRALAEQGRPRAERLRPLLHRAQPRPPRPRRHPRGPGQLPHGGELLGVPAAHRRPAASARRGESSAPASTAWATRSGRSTTTSCRHGR